MALDITLEQRANLARLAGHQIAQHIPLLLKEEQGAQQFRRQVVGNRAGHGLAVAAETQFRLDGRGMVGGLSILQRRTPRGGERARRPHGNRHAHESAAGGFVFIHSLNELVPRVALSRSQASSSK